MLFYIFIAFLTPFFYALSVTIESMLSNRCFKHQTTMLFYVSLMNVVFLPLILIFGFPDIPSQYCMWLYLLLGILDVIYLLPYYTALKVIDTSIVAALFSLGEIMVPVLSYFMLGEVLNLHQYIGFAIIIMASVALSIKGNKIPKLSRAFWWMVITSIIISFKIVLTKFVIEKDQNWINMVIYPYIISGIIPFALLFIKKYRKDIIKNFPPYLNKCKYFAAHELLYFLGFSCSVFGLSKLSPVVSTAISSTEPIFLLTIGGLLLYFWKINLKEKITHKILMKKIFCFILIILGVILVV